MARRIRIQFRGAPHQIINRGKCRQDVFASEAAWQAIIRMLDEAAAQFRRQVHDERMQLGALSAGWVIGSWNWPIHCGKPPPHLVLGSPKRSGWAPHRRFEPRSRDDCSNQRVDPNGPIPNGPIPNGPMDRPGGCSTRLS
ncbi:MAG: hypothetical protein EXS37_21835 [Opitutus sp.]|nr:hypothetical protein [Opitutus sp.]